MQATLANQGVEYDLIAQEVESAEYRRGVSSTYTTRTRTRGMVLHMLGGLVMCTKGAVIHKVTMRRCGHKGGTKGCTLASTNACVDGTVLQFTSFLTFLPADHDMLDNYGTALTHGILPRIPF